MPGGRSALLELPLPDTVSIMTIRRVLATAAAALGVVVAPIAVGATIGAGTAGAAPWQVGPLYRAEFTGEAAQYLCSKSAAHANSSRIIELVPCTYDSETDSWYRIALDTYGLAPRGLGSS